jgi:hypothetical protein
MTLAAWFALLSIPVQAPPECAGARELTKGPFCYFATFVVHLEFVAGAFRQEDDSIAAVVRDPRSSADDILRTIFYWNLERRRVSLRTCAELSSFDVSTDSLAAEATEAVCAVLRGMVVHDSIGLANRILDLEQPDALSASSRAMRDAASRQKGESLNRSFVIASQFFTWLVVREDPATNRMGRLLLTVPQRAWLVARLRKIALPGQRAGVFGQSADMLAKWLDRADWKLLGQ